MKVVIYGNENTSATSIELFGTKEVYDYQKEFYRDLKKYITYSNQPSQGGSKAVETKVMDFLHRVESVTYSGWITKDSLSGASNATAVRTKLISYGNNGGPCGLKATNNAATTTLLDWNTTKQAYIMKMSMATELTDVDVPLEYAVTIQFIKAIQQ